MPCPRFLSVLVILGLTGCPRSNPPASLPPAVAEAAVAGPLQVLVLDDPSLAEVIEREWGARSDGEFEIVRGSSTAGKEALESSGADVIFFPAPMLGQLVEGNMVRRLPNDLIDGLGYAKLDVFDLLRRREMQWGGKSYAVACGSPQLVLMVRTDIVADNPTCATWSELNRRLTLWSADGRGELPSGGDDRDDGQSEPTEATVGRHLGVAPFALVQPLGPGWAGRVLLAHAAPYVFRPSQISTVFDFRTLEPRIATPPFVRALEEIVQEHAAGPPEEIGFSAADALDFFLQGRAAMAVTWPGAIPRSPGAAAIVPFPLAIWELPGSAEQFDTLRGEWSARDDGSVLRVTLLDAAARLGALTRGSRHVALGKKFLGWATGPEQSAPLFSRSASAAPFRQSHLLQADAWVDGRIPSDAARGYVQIVAQSLSRSEAIGGIRLPGHERYMQSLDAAVHQALRGEASAADALAAAARQWQAISGELGQAEQLRAYRRSLGVADD